METRKFDSGAYRSANTGKIDYDSILSPLVIQRFGEYCQSHNDAAGRDPRNWQLGIPLADYMKSAWRHFHAWWSRHSVNDPGEVSIEDDICGLMFNLQGYLHETLKARGYAKDAAAISDTPRQIHKPTYCDGCTYCQLHCECGPYGTPCPCSGKIVGHCSKRDPRHK